MFSLHFNGHFPGEHGQAGTRISPFWILLELRVTEVVSGDNWSCKTCKAPVRCHYQQTPSFLQDRRPSYRPTNSVRTLNENKRSERKRDANTAHWL